MKSDDTVDNGMAFIYNCSLLLFDLFILFYLGMAPKEEEEDEDVLESLFECLFCQRPIMCKASVVIKMCGRYSCK